MWHVLRSYVTHPPVPPVGEVLRRYPDAGEPLTCEPIGKGLLNHGYRVSTTRGSYFLKHHLDKHHLDDPSGDHATIVRQHRATQQLHSLGVPVAPPLADTQGDTVTVIGSRRYALHRWVDGLHRDGAQLTTAQSRRPGRCSEPYTWAWSRSWRRTRRLRQGDRAPIPPTRSR